MTQAAILPGPARAAVVAATAADDTGFVNLARAIARWREALGEDCVRIDRLRGQYEANCIGIARSVPVVLRPRTESEVRAVMAIASACRVPIYPISTGNNWGYGSAVPVTDRCVVVDLSRMNRIVEFDAELGLVTVEPGVTQGHLREHLDRHGLQFMVPVTGAGPTCSLVGNALERGYGITPHADHFAAVRSLRAVLPNGEVYCSALTEAGAPIVDGGHKWGLGPYLDGLYSQGGFGIVTQMTIALAPVPEAMEAFLVEIDDDAALDGVVAEVRDLLQTNGGGLSGINLMNRLRVMSMFHPYPHGQVAPRSAIPAELVERLGRESRLPSWLGVGAVYGDREVVAGLHKAVHRRLGRHARRLRFVSQPAVQTARRFAALAPAKMRARLNKQAEMATELLDILSGRPRETAVRLAYWKNTSAPPEGVPLNPARDGCGLIWFAPLVPMRAADVRTYVGIVEDICPRYGIDPLVTLTSVSGQCFDSTVPILYGPPSEADRGHACYDALFDACSAHGYLPYRLSLRSMHRFTDRSESPYWRLVKTLKGAVDPDNLIAPGRYAPVS